ncbi:hypothetical protein B9G54_05685 [Alloscardovia macacae]|uniref:Uncharacterized protein n=1 Tax=Alloscardovia macacae TaxID=1160091 RepID=A0A1Y2SWX3_9BIFI|nr:hypothetical protein B9G54_05685 [Alloscardovia macacae]OTA29976.1 hypothetical protein B9T39_01005 [Alloscardovia macacae]
MWGKIWNYVKLIFTSLAFIITWSIAVGAYPDKEIAVRGLGLFTLVAIGIFIRYVDVNTLKYKWIVSLGSMFVVAWIIRWFFPI